MEIGLKFLDEVAFYVGLGIDFHTFARVLRLNDDVYHLLRSLKRGIDKDEQISGSV